MLRADPIVVAKRGWFWTALHWLVVIVTFGRNRRFATDYVTTIGRWIAVPVGMEPSAGLLAHERHHVSQFARAGLGVPEIGIVVLGIAYLLLPLPLGLAWCRWRIERTAYVAGWTVELAAMPAEWRFVRRQQLIAHGVEQMTAGAYGWAWPFPAAVRRWFEEHTP